MRQKTLLCISIMVSLIIPPKLICASCGKDPGSEGRFSPMPHDSSPSNEANLANTGWTNHPSNKGCVSEKRNGVQPNS